MQIPFEVRARATVANLTIGKWLLVLFTVALLSWGAADKHNGAQIGLLAGGLLLYWAARRLATNERQWLLKASAVLATVLVMGEWVWAGFDRPAWPINPNALAGMLLITLPVTGLLALPFLLVTESRAAILPAFAYCWNALTTALSRPIFSTDKEPARWKGIALGAVVALVLGVGLVLWRPETVDARFRAWAEAIEIWQRDPLWGVGYGNYAYYAYTERLKLHADSLPLTFLAEMGVLGGGVALLAVGGIVARVWHSSARPALKMGLGLWLVQQLADHTSAEMLVLATLMIALADVEAP